MPITAGRDQHYPNNGSSATIIRGQRARESSHMWNIAKLVGAMIFIAAGLLLYYLDRDVSRRGINEPVGVHVSTSDVRQDVSARAGVDVTFLMVGPDEIVCVVSTEAPNEQVAVYVQTAEDIRLETISEDEYLSVIDAYPDEDVPTDAHAEILAADVSASDLRNGVVFTTDSHEGLFYRSGVLFRARGASLSQQVSMSSRRFLLAVSEVGVDFEPVDGSSSHANVHVWSPTADFAVGDVYPTPTSEGLGFFDWDDFSDELIYVLTRDRRWEDGVAFGKSLVLFGLGVIVGSAAFGRKPRGRRDELRVDQQSPDEQQTLRTTNAAETAHR